MLSSDVKLKGTDPINILKLISTLTYRSGKDIQRKINKYLQEQTNATAVFQVPLFPESDEAIIEVIGTKPLEHEIRFSISNHVFNNAVQKGSPFVVKTYDLDGDLKDMIQSTINPVPQNFLVIPVPHPKYDIICLLACVIDYKKENELCIDLVLDCFYYCVSTVLSALACEEETRLKTQCQSLLSVSKNLFSNLGNMTDLLREIIAQARELTNAKHCLLILIDREQNKLHAKIFDENLSDKPLKVITITKDMGIVGFVATTGEVVNVRDVGKHPLFYQEVDAATGVEIKNLLCFPILKDDSIIGVVELYNKQHGYYFDLCDEQVAMAFSVYCGISIMHSMAYKKINDIHARNQVSRELMLYHMNISNEDIKHVLQCKTDHLKYQLCDFKFIPRSINENETPCLVVHMFKDLNLIQEFKIKHETLISFISLLQRGYRDIPFHNWMHAFSVTHFAYVLIKKLSLVESMYMTKLESLALLVACLGHDVDHTGTNNSFQMHIGTLLAKLYSNEGSIIERHHLALTLLMLNAKNCNILEGMSREDYVKFLEYTKVMILATDLAQHYQMFPEQKMLLKYGYQHENSAHKSLLFSFMMTCCDLSDYTKDWKNANKTTQLIYEEYFKQGDVEKSMGGIPQVMMDREKANIPELMMQFFTSTVIPVYETLAQHFPETKCLRETTKQSLRCWKQAREIFIKERSKGYNSMEILTNNSYQKQVLKTVNYT